MATRKVRKTRRAGATQSRLHNFLPKRFFKSNLTRGIGKRNLLTKGVTIKKGRNERGFKFKNLKNQTFNLNNLNNANIEHSNNLIDARKGNSYRTPRVVANIGLSPEESQKYAELYHNYTLNNSANADEKFIYAIDEDNSLSKNTKIKFVKHFLASLEAGSELNRKAGKNAISEIYTHVDYI